MRFSEIIPSKGSAAPLEPETLDAGKAFPQTFQDLKNPPFARKLKPKEIYGQLIQISKDFLNGLSQKPVKLPDLDSLCEALDGVIQGLESDPSRLLEFVERSTPDDYLPGHLANVAVLSVALAQQLGWTKEAQKATGVGAILHDAGEAFNRPRDIALTKTLTEEERKKFRVPSQECFEILRGFLHSLDPDSRSMVLRVILQCHERISGLGYPQKLKGSEIAVPAQVVGLCHAYESLSHPRAYRPRRMSHETLRHLIELAGDAFDAGLIKKLWEILSLFPPGSFVKLTSGEIAKVVLIKKDQPIKPMVKITISALGERVKEELILDLSREGSPSIEGAVDECALKLSDPALHLELKAQRWWME